MALKAQLKDVEAQLVVIGERVRIARVRRCWTAAELAERVGVERRTISRLEHGDAGVRTGVLFSVVWVLGLWETAVGLADPARDEAGLALERRRQPKRARKGSDVELDF